MSGIGTVTRPSQLRDPGEGECLSTYLAAWRRCRNLSSERFGAKIARYDPGVVAALLEDPDFPEHPNWIDVVAKVTGLPSDMLVELGAPIGPWHLSARCRRQVCVECLVEHGKSSDHRREKVWTYATFTLCPAHALPFYEAPALGWEWSEQPFGERRYYSRLILETERLRDSWVSTWSRRGGRIKEIISLAELNAWMSSCGRPQKGRWAMCEGQSVDRQVWEDLLCVLCSNWGDEKGEPLVQHGLPHPYDPDCQLGRVPKVSCLQPQDMSGFCRIFSPDLRRACVLLAAIAVRPCGMSELIKSLPGRLEGWDRIHKKMPGVAREWLSTRAKRWPQNQVLLNQRLWR